MKIALLNLPLDDNYGGNLQRFALSRILERLGHEVVHLNLLYHACLPWYKAPYSYTKRFVQRILFKKNILVFQEKNKNEKNRARFAAALEFNNLFVPHTESIVSLQEIKKIVRQNNFQAVVVGSDQVWRPNMTTQIGLKSYFLDFLPQNILRVAYAVSVGSKNECSLLGAKKGLGRLYRGFKAVSVREKFLLPFFESLGWNNPKAELVLDPTLLLDQSDYVEIIDKECSNVTENKIYAYVLDYNQKIENFIGAKTRELGIPCVVDRLDKLGEKTLIQQWIKNIACSKFVVTDSFHGVVFSIIFQKPFACLKNDRRGNDRLTSLFDVLGIDPARTENLEWGRIIENLKFLQRKSLLFLEKSLS